MDTRPRVALATVSETREDFREQRERFVREEMTAIGWLRESADILESEIITSTQQIAHFAGEVRRSDAQALIVHIPVWTDPVLSVKLSELIPLPLLLMGNRRPETSSIVGLLGAGGALDQVGITHHRIFDHHLEDAHRRVKAFTRAAYALRTLRGQTLGLFGGRSLGMITATGDSAQLHRMFGIDIEQLDQGAIIQEAESVPQKEVDRHTAWLTEHLAGVEYGGLFNAQGLERQVRSYIATGRLIRARGYDFVSVKCQPELSDGYVSQCLVHMLMNGSIDADGEKSPVVHACEADIDGALTMQILHLLSGGLSASLLDLRWLEVNLSTWTLANCGALPATFASSPEDPSGLSGIRAVPHVFGRGGGGAFPMIVAPQHVTMARLCRKKGNYWLAIVKGEVEKREIQELNSTTPAFPQAYVSTSTDESFLENYGSNHIHMVSGDIEGELEAFCRLAEIPWRKWD